MSASHFFLLAAAFTALVAAVADLRTGHIPNALTLGVLGLAPLAHGVTAFWRGHSAAASAGSVGASLLGAALCALLPLAMYRSGGLGGGDVKLFAAVGAMTGALIGLHAESYAFVFGMVWSLFLVARSGRLVSTLGNVAALLGASARLRPRVAEHPVALERMMSIRFGPAIFVGTLFAVVTCWRSA